MGTQDYNLNTDDGRPDDVIVKIYEEFRECQQNKKSWGAYSQPTQPLIGRLRKLFKCREGPPDPKNVRVIIFKNGNLIADGKSIIKHILGEEGTTLSLDGSDACVATGLLCELYRCAVPRIVETMKREEYRYVFYPDVEWFGGLFAQLHAFWAKDDSIVLFYMWGRVDTFKKWAFTWQPDLYARLIEYRDDMIVVIVPSIMRMSAPLLAELQRQRDKIWYERNLN